MDNKFDEFTTEELVSIFSCFTNITVPDNVKTLLPNLPGHCVVNDIVLDIVNRGKELEQKELSMQFGEGGELQMHFDLMDYIYEWCKCEDVNDCKLLLQKMEMEKEIFLGEFIKAILKINNISNEFEKVAEQIGNIELLQKLKDISNKTLKYVATNQSLYI